MTLNAVTIVLISPPHLTAIAHVAAPHRCSSLIGSSVRPAVIFFTFLLNKVEMSIAGVVGRKLGLDTNTGMAIETNFTTTSSVMSWAWTGANYDIFLSMWQITNVHPILFVIKGLSLEGILLVMIKALCVKRLLF